jgi:hypothetical protein
MGGNPNRQDQQVGEIDCRWHNFNAKKGRIGSKGTTGAIRHPSMRPEERPSEFTESTAASTKNNSVHPDDIFKKK